MLTAIATLLLSAVGGGIIGALFTDSYPKDSICSTCETNTTDDDYYYEEQYDGDRNGEYEYMY